jgi:DNA-binding transcriptional LysR family regulator
VTLHQLRIFDAVSRHLNITKASAELHISEPSVFQQIKSLEESCGLRLYRKVGRGVELTPEGEKLRIEGQEILQRVTTLERQFKAIRKSSGTAPLRVGGSHAPSKSVLPLCLAAFKRDHPLVQVTLQTQSSRSIENLVLNSQLEIAIVTHCSDLPELCYVPFGQDRVVLFVSARHPVARKKALSLAEIAAEPLIAHRGIRRGTGKNTMSILKQIKEQGRRPNILMECNSSEAVKAAVMRGAGIGILMEAHLDDEIRRREVKILKIRDVKDLRINSYCIYKKAKPLSDNARDFLDLLRQTAGRKHETLRRPLGSLFPTKISA